MLSYKAFVSCLVIFVSGSSFVLSDELEREAQTERFSIEPGYCGVAAVELVAKRLGCSSLCGAEYQKLRNLPVASFLDLRHALEANGFCVESYRIDASDSYRWNLIRRLLEHGVAQAIVRVELTSGEGEGWHYLVASDSQKNEILLVDPATMSQDSVNRESFFSKRSSIEIQIVSRSYSDKLFGPLQHESTFYWTILPGLAVLGVFFERSKRSVTRKVWVKISPTSST